MTAATCRPAKPGETPGQCDPELCTDPTCSDPVHLPDRDEDAAWLWDDDVQRRRADV